MVCVCSNTRFQDSLLNSDRSGCIHVFSSAELLDGSYMSNACFTAYLAWATRTPWLIKHMLFCRKVTLPPWINGSLVHEGSTWVNMTSIRGVIWQQPLWCKMWLAQNSLEERLDSLGFPGNVPVDPWGHYFKLPGSILYMNTAILMHSRQLIHFVGRSATTRSCDPRIRPVLARCARYPPGFLGPAVVLWLWGSMCNHLQFVIRRGRVLIQLWSARWVNFFCSLYIACLWVWLTSGPARQQKIIAKKNCWFWSSTPPKYKFPALNQGQRMAHRCYKRMGAPGFPRKVLVKTSSLGFSQASALGVPVLGVSALCFVTATVLDCMLCYMYIYPCYLCWYVYTLSTQKSKGFKEIGKYIIYIYVHYTYIYIYYTSGENIILNHSRGFWGTPVLQDD